MISHDIIRSAISNFQETYPFSFDLENGLSSIKISYDNSVVARLALVRELEGNFDEGKQVSQAE